MREKGKRITIEEEKQIAHRYQEIKSCIKVGKEFGIYPQGVLNCARKYEIQTRINKKVTYKIEKEIINLYNKYQNSNIVAKEIGISDETVLRYLHKNKIILKKEKEKIKEVIEKKKICSSCKKEKSTEDFPLQNKNKNKLGVRSQCKECSVINQKNTKLKKMYGISLEKYREMLSNQNNGCAICGSPETLSRSANCCSTKERIQEPNKSPGPCKSYSP